jgi:hypothetical protein
VVDALADHTQAAFNRHRIATAVTNAWQAAKIKQFEHVAVSSSSGLLRVTGTPVHEKMKGRRRPTLVADNGVLVRRFAALPSPPDEGSGPAHGA